MPHRRFAAGRAVILILACGFATLIARATATQTPQTQPAATQPAATQPASARPASTQPRNPRRNQRQPAPLPQDTLDIPPLVSRGVEFIVSAQEGDEKSEWPYEGVYRVAGEIPIGYRIGGTAIGALALLGAPGYADDTPRQHAVAKALKFIIDNAHHPLMNPDYDGGYDVRGWGYTYGLQLLLRVRTLKCAPPELTNQIDPTIKYFITAIQQTEINKVGGWNYARSQGKEAVSPPSPFMTAPTLQALFEAKKQDFEVDQAVVNRALDALEQARTPTGSFLYSGIEGKDRAEPVPGSVGRMVASETTLLLAGRSTVASVRSAVDSFIVHWEWLDKRRAQQGTHMPPYNIAPYYFYYAHYYAAQAVEMLPQRERGEYRRRINELLMKNRLPDGTWNDRVFPRTANYGTAMSIMALMMPQAEAPAKWAAGTGH